MTFPGQEIAILKLDYLICPCFPRLEIPRMENSCWGGGWIEI